MARRGARWCAVLAATAFGSAGAQQSAGPARRVAPEIGAVFDLIGDLSPGGSTQRDSARFSVRSVELAFGGALSPRLRADARVTLDDRGHSAIAQAFVTLRAMPWRLDGRAGRFLLPVSAVNTTHRYDLHTVEVPYVAQKFLSPDGLSGTGLSARRSFTGLGFTHELIVSWVDRFGDPTDSLTAASKPSKFLDGMGYAARLRNVRRLSRAAELELSASAVTGKRPTWTGFTDAHGVNAVNARQTLLGADAAFRWSGTGPVARTFLLQGEWMRQLNDKSWLANPSAANAPTIRDFDGGYLFARWQLARRTFVGGRWDAVQDPSARGARLTSGTADVEWLPSANAKVIAGIERRQTGRLPSEDRVLIRAAFTVGTHTAHD